MSTNGLLTAEEIVVAAMQELGVLAAGERPTGEDLTDAIRALNWMLKGWRARGLTSWLTGDRTVTLTGGSATVELDQDIADVVSVRIATSGIERPLYRYERGQYTELPNKTSVGSPAVFYAERGVATVTLHVWPVPIADTTLILDTEQVIADVIDPTDVLQVPQQWTEAIYLALAGRIATTHGVVRTDPNTANLIIQRARVAEQALFDADRPASFFMGAGR